MQTSTFNKRQSASDYAYSELRRKIIELEYAPSEQLIEENLSKDLEISRTPLRQALYRLELEHLVIKQPNGRIRVMPVTLREAREVFKVREVLEGLIAQEAANNLTTERLDELEDVLSLMRRAAKKDRKHDIVRYGGEFHRILHEVSANQTANRFLEQLSNRIDRYRRLSGYKNPGYMPMVAVEEHQKVFDALKTGNSSQVEEAMRSHIRRSLLSIKETLEVYFDNK
jgi:DNA-binding GntR family transcriptional regulator